MPLAKVEVRKPRSPEDIQAVIDAIYWAQRDALQVPATDRQVRYIEHRPEHFAAPPGKSDNYTVVEISLFPGRSVDAKRALYQGIVKRLEPLGIPRDEVFVVLHEPPLENWGMGDHAACDIDLGFNLNV
jgi:phenylpyruvate tautomerase PptA (4-oxalocrotonate tautomerase family)